MSTRAEAKRVAAISSDGNLNTAHVQTSRKGKIMYWLWIKVVSMSPRLRFRRYTARCSHQLPRALYSYKAFFMENYFTSCEKP